MDCVHVARARACSTMDVCVAKECDTSADCKSPDAPACSNGLCIPGCATDDDCMGVPNAPHCDASDHACVGCVTSDQCPAEMAICDADTRKPTVSVPWRQSSSTSRTSELTLGPARLSYASQNVTPQRRVIRLLGGTYNLGATTVTALGNSEVLDGTGTVLTSSAGPAIRLGGPTTIEGVHVQVTNAFVNVQAGGHMRLVNSQSDGLALEISLS
jgi:hypothetical protein